MADKIRKTDIYIQKEQGNLMVVDPNKVYDENQKPVERYVPQEELVYYVNLEANPIPRSYLDLGEEASPNRTVVAYGKLNYLSPNGGKPLDTSWTEDFKGTVNNRTAVDDSRREYYTGYVDYDYINNNQYDTQLLGIKDIQIQTKPDSLKTSIITIRMVDVRGRALFEKGPESIYSTFFHLPYPMFTLTVKGYYGEAVTYQMVLSGQVKTSFESDGDYYVTATFMATNQKLLNDIKLGDADVAPYLYQYEKTITDDDGNIKTCKSTRGHDILEQVYKNYYNDGMVDAKLAEKPLTIPQFMDLIDRLSTFLEDELFDETDISFFSDISLYGTKLKQFNNAINGWFQTYTNTQNAKPFEGDNEEGFVYVQFKKEFSDGFKTVDDKKFDLIEGEVTYSLLKIFDTYIEFLSSINYFGKYKKIKLNLDKSGKKSKEIEYSAPSISGLKSARESFYYNKSEKQLSINKFEVELEKVINQYTESFEKIKDQVEEVLSQVQNKQLGFRPTLKNVMGVILANTETFLRVMEYTHRQAYLQRSNPDRKKSIENRDNPDSVNDVVYPFPTVYGTGRDNNLQEFYPGDPAIRNQIKGYNVNTWPEVKLVEEYVTHQLTVGDTVAGTFCFDTNETAAARTETSDKSNIFANDIYNNNEVFNESSFNTIVYRIYNRAIYSVFGTGYSENTIKVLGREDAKNASKSINSLLSGKGILRNGLDNFQSLYGPNYLQKDIELRQSARQNLLTESIEKSAEDKNSYTVLTLSDLNTNNFEDADTVLLNEAKSYKTTGLEPYPFANDEWVNKNLKVKSNIYNRKLSTKYDDTLRYTYTSSENDLSTKNYFKDSSINPLQTPGFVTTDSHVVKGYWLLNTIPTRSLRGVFTEGSLKENYFARFLGGDVKEINKIQMLKWGSIWYRYTNEIETGVDILDTIWSNLDITQYTQGTYGGNTFNFNKTSTQFDIGFYPELVIEKINQLVDGAEYQISDIDTLISDGKLVVTNYDDITVTDTNQIINVWRSIFITDEGVILLPSYVSQTTDITSSEIDRVINNSVSEDWSTLNNDKDFNIDFNDTTIVKPDTNMYVFDEDGELVTDYSIEDLVSLFSYETLEEFKNEFLKFGKTKDEILGGSYQSIYEPFLRLKGVDIKDSIEESKKWVENTIGDNFKTNQIDEKIYIVLHKPLNVDFATLTSYVNTNISDPIEFAEFTTIDEDLFNKIVGKVSDTSVQESRKNFFSDSNIDASEENMKRFKGLINVWGEWKDGNPNGDADGFKTFLTSVINESVSKMDVYVREIFGQFGKLVDEEDVKEQVENIVTNVSGGVELQKIVYRQLKNLNDTWIGGFNWEKTNMAKMFKYINYLNEPIGDKYLMDLRVLTDYYNPTNRTKSIGSFISHLLSKNSLSEPISFAANINFYGNLTSDSKNIEDAKKVANAIFGTHTHVTKNGTPGFVVFFRSNASEYLNIKKLEYGYGSDSIDLSSSKPDPISSKNVDTIQIREGGRGIAFNVDFGIQHQNMFSDFNIQSYDGIKSGEELIVTEEIANSKKGSSMGTISTNLLDIMKTRVYSCTIKMIGNAMIQPFMYFNLRYIPIYSGTYMILSVEHSLSPDSGMITTFTGVRVSKAGISEIDKGMVKARRNLLENLIDKIKNKPVKEQKGGAPYPGDTRNQGGGKSDNKRDGDCQANKFWEGITKYDVPNNRTTKTNKELKEILDKVAFENFSTSFSTDFLSPTAQKNIARFTFVVSRIEQGKGDGVSFMYDNPFGLHVDGKGSKPFKDNVKGYFCPMTSDGYVRPTAVFHEVGKETVDDGIERAYLSFMRVMIERGRNYFNDNNFWESSNANNYEYLLSLWANYWNTHYNAIKTDTGVNGKGTLVTNTNLYPKGIVYYTNGKSKDRKKYFDVFKKHMSKYNQL